MPIIYVVENLYTITQTLPKNRQMRIYSSSRRYSMNVGPWAVSFSALVPLHESHSASGLMMNYKCTSAVTRHHPELYIYFLQQNETPKESRFSFHHCAILCFLGIFPLDTRCRLLLYIRSFLCLFHLNNWLFFLILKEIIVEIIIKFVFKIFQIIWCEI